MPPGTEILLDDARMACDQAFQAEVIGGSITAPVLALLRTDYGQTGWTVHPLPHITARFAPDVGVLVCIVQSRTKDGTYLDGSYGYQLSWKVRLVSWPTGRVISERSLRGGRSPAIKSDYGTAYGTPPLSQFLSWYYGQVQVPSVIVPRTSFSQVNPIAGWKLLAVLETDKALEIWNVATGKIQAQYDKNDVKVTSMTASPVKPEVAFCEESGQVSVWDLNTSSFTIIKETGGYYRLSYSPDGKVLAGFEFGEEPKEFSILVWDTTTRQLLHSMEGQAGIVSSRVFSPDGKRIVSTSYDRTIKVWEPASGQLLFTLPYPDLPFMYLEFSADGKSLIFIGTTQAQVWDLASNKTLRTFNFKFEIERATYSPQTGILAIAAQDQLELWNTSTGFKEYAFPDHSVEITVIAFSPDGSRLAYGDDNGRLFLWDSNNRQLLKEFYGHTDKVRFLQFSPDGRTMLSISNDSTIRFWDLEGE
jgi:WD40 repeat protein